MTVPRPRRAEIGIALSLAVALVLVTACGANRSPAESALEAAAPVEFAAWRAAGAALELARQEAGQEALAARADASTALARAEDEVAHAISLRNEATLVRPAAAAYLEAKKAWEDAGAAFKAAELLGSVGDGLRALNAQIEALARVMATAEAALDTLDPAGSLAETAEAKGVDPADLLGAEAEAAVARADFALRAEAEASSAAMAAQRTWKIAGSATVQAFEAAERVEVDARSRLQQAAPAAWEAYVAANHENPDLANRK